VGPQGFDPWTFGLKGRTSEGFCAEVGARISCIDGTFWRRPRKTRARSFNTELVTIAKGDEVQRNPAQNRCSPQRQAGIRAECAAALIEKFRVETSRAGLVGPQHPDRRGGAKPRSPNDDSRMAPRAGSWQPLLSSERRDRAEKQTARGSRVRETGGPQSAAVRLTVSTTSVSPAGPCRAGRWNRRGGGRGGVRWRG
jgi:hypothetical protein